MSNVVQIVMGENMECGADADTVLRKIRDEARSVIMRDAKPDTELLKILSDRIVTLAPGTSAVEQAVVDIGDLARRRAES